ncbi:MAG: nucleoside-triphosphatase [Spirochaetota bacterium]
MNIVITGAVGVGKTSVCEKVAVLLKGQGISCGGIITPKATDEGIIIIDLMSGRREILAAVVDIYRGPRIGRYYFNPTGIAFGIDAIERAKNTDVIFIDEVGPLELSGGGFAKALGLLRYGKLRNSVMVIREYLLDIFLEGMDNRVSIFETTLKNRNILPERIFRVLTYQSS